MIPEAIDHKALVCELIKDGWTDFKLGEALGWNHGYVSQLRRGHIKEMRYSNAAKLYNFYLLEKNSLPVANGEKGD